MPGARLTLALVVTALALAGCGEGATTPPAKIKLWSPAVQTDGFVAPNVRCGGGTLWLPLRWGAIPAGTKYLVVYFGRFAPAGSQRTEELRVPFGSAFPGVALTAGGTQANAFPPGEPEPHYYGGDNCVPVPRGQKYLAGLFALDSPVVIPGTLDEAFAKRVTEELLGFEDPVTQSPSAERLIGSTLAMGSLVATYGQPR